MISVNNEQSLYKQQKKARPKIEDVICEHFDTDIRQNALDFSKWLRVNKMSPSFSATNTWQFKHKGETVGFIKIDSQEWQTAGSITGNKAKKTTFNICFSPYKTRRGDYYDFINSEGLKDEVINGLSPCLSLHERCSNYRIGWTMTVCGQEVKNKCKKYYLMFPNPDINVIDKIKQVITARNGIVE